MSGSNKKWWLALVVICCLAPAAFADRGQYQEPDRDYYQNHNHGCDPREWRCRPQQVPEGGSTAIYVLGAGLTCLGAMFLRSKQGKPAVQYSTARWTSQ
jgi:hypothetical protein